MISFKNFIQVAGIIDKEESELIINAGVNFLGFPLRLPVNKEDISEDEAEDIIKKITPPNFGILITYLNKSKEIKDLCNKLGTEIVQLHGEVELEELSNLKTIFPESLILKSLVIGKINNELLFNSMHKMSDYVDAFILDTFDPATGASGATGKTHDWEVSKLIVEISKKPVILAGGLNPFNVHEAIMKVKPAGVDVHTGVEGSDGRKDKILVEKFVSEANKAFKKLNGQT